MIILVSFQYDLICFLIYTYIYIYREREREREREPYTVDPPRIYGITAKLLKAWRRRVTGGRSGEHFFSLSLSVYREKWAKILVPQEEANESV